MNMFGAAFRWFSFVGLSFVALVGDAFAGPCPVVAVVISSEMPQWRH